MNNRVKWIDYAKAFAIFLVVFGHSGISGWTALESVITGVHVPLFVFLSGYFARNKKQIIQATISDVKHLILPFVLFSLMLIPFNICVQYIQGGSAMEQMVSNISTPKFWLSKFFMDDAYACGPIWFLGALFMIKMLFRSIAVIKSKINKEEMSDTDVWSAIVCVMIAIILLYMDIVHSVHLMSVDSAFSLFPYYLLGALVPKKMFDGSNRGFRFSILLLLLYIFISINNGYISYDRSEFGNSFVVMYIEGVVGCLSIATLFSCLERFDMRILSMLGKDSLTVLGLHIIFIQIFRFALKSVYGNELPLICLFAISFFICLICVLLARTAINRILPK